MQLQQHAAVQFHQNAHFMQAWALTGAIRGDITGAAAVPAHQAHLVPG